MNFPRHIELALRKQRLQIRSAALRRELAGHGRALAPAFAAADRVYDGALWIRRHPLVVVAATAALVVARPRRALRWAGRALMAWQTWRRLRSVVAGGSERA